MNYPLYDGILCVGGGTYRLEFRFTDGVGHVASTTSLVTAGSIQPGETAYYQFWYRDPLGTCGTGANFTSALQISFH